MKTALKYLQQFKKQNPNFNWQQFSTWGKEEFDALIGAELHSNTKKHKPENIEGLQAYQRLFRLTQDHASAGALVEAGYHSGIQIADMAKHEFVKDAAPLFKSNGISAEKQAALIHKKAVGIKTQVVNTYMDLVQRHESHYKNARFANLTTEGTGLAGIPSYSELFGNADFCSCEECRSILSPVAYFVDLMRMQDRYIHPPGSSDNPLHLKTRRPDLWNIELSCENTNTEISKLEVVNEVLEKVHFQPKDFFLNMPLTHNLDLKNNAIASITKKPTQSTFSPQGASWNGEFEINFSAPNPDFNGITHSEVELNLSAYPEQNDFSSELLTIVCNNGASITFQLSFTAYYNAPPVERQERFELSVMYTPVSGASQGQTISRQYVDRNDPEGPGSFSFNGRVTVLLNHKGGEVQITPLDQSVPQHERWSFLTDSTAAIIKSVTMRGGDIRCTYRNLEAKNIEPPVKDTSDKQLAKTYYPWNLPVNMAYTRLSESFKQKNFNFSEVLSNLSNNPSDFIPVGISMAALGVSKEQWVFFSTPDAKKASLAISYGLSSFGTDFEAIKPVNIFLKQTALSRSELDDLLTQNLSQDEIAANIQNKFYINDGKDAIGIDDKNQLTNLTLDKLDRINRFVRLAHAIDFTFAELDTAILAYTTTDIDPISESLDRLSWMKKMQAQRSSSVYELAALLGPLRNHGKKNGPTFFESVFNAPTVPNPPDWLNTTWAIPSLDEPNPVNPANQQIQVALSAALKISQTDLIRMANAIQPGKSGKSNLFALTPHSLAILYRMSKLPNWTGLPISFLFQADLINSIQFAVGLIYSLNTYPLQGITMLQQFADWLNTTHFTPDDVQYLITGKTTIPQLQNKAISKDTWVNFIVGLKDSLAPVLFTWGTFQEALHGLLKTSELRSEAMTFYDRFYTEKPEGSKTAYVNGQFGVIYSVPSEYVLNGWANSIFLCAIQSSDFPTLKTGKGIILTPWKDLINKGYILASKDHPALEGTLVKPIENYTAFETEFEALGYSKLQTQQIESILNQAKLNVESLRTEIAKRTEELMRYEQPIQQQTFAQQLGALYGISYQYFPLLLAETSITPVQVLEKKNSSSKHKLQEYVNLITGLSLSPAEMQSILKHPSYYGRAHDYNPGLEAGQLLTLKMFQTLMSFKQIVKGFHDSHNDFIAYFDFVSPANEANDIPCSPELAAQQLSPITGWNQDEVILLIKSLWPVDEYDQPNSPQPSYGTVAGVMRMKQVFDYSQSFGVDIKTMISFYNSTDMGVSFSAEALSNAIFAGVQHNSKASTIQHITNRINEVRRDALVPLVLHTLQKKYPSIQLQTAEDLYEYLLMDVKAGGVLTTSRIKEAISTVQLYVYRCLNNLEPQAHVDDELIAWWPWVEHYRTWQANREVFLYPENYIEPQLRKNKTPEFAQLQNDLQQADLTQKESVEIPFHNYVDRFTSISDLEIIGSASFDGNDQDNVNRMIALVGKTKTQPYSFYFLTAQFAQVTKQIGGSRGGAILKEFQPISWGHWQPITCQMKPLGGISPVYAFDKWHVFWVEEQLSGASESPTANATSKASYSAHVQCSHMNFNQEWVPTQLVGIADYPKAALKTLTPLNAERYHSVKPVYIASLNQIFMAYGDQWEEGGVTHNGMALVYPNRKEESLPMAIYANTVPPVPFSLPDALTHQVKCGNASYSYYSLFGEQPTIAAPKGFSTWLKLSALPSTGNYAPILSTEKSTSAVSINSTGNLCLDKIQIANSPAIQTGKWQHVQLRQDVAFDLTATKLIPGEYSMIELSGVIVVIGPNLDGHLEICSPGTDQITYQTTAVYTDTATYQAPSLVVNSKKLYLAYLDITGILKAGYIPITSLSQLNNIALKEIEALYPPTLANHGGVQMTWTGPDRAIRYWKDITSSVKDSAIFKLNNDTEYPCFGTIVDLSLSVNSASHTYLAWPGGRNQAQLCLAELSSSDSLSSVYQQEAGILASPVLVVDTSKTSGHQVGLAWINAQGQTLTAEISTPSASQPVLTNTTVINRAPNARKLMEIRYAQETFGYGWTSTDDRNKIIYIHGKYRNQWLVNGQLVSSTDPITTTNVLQGDAIYIGTVPNGSVHFPGEMRETLLLDSGNDLNESLDFYLNAKDRVLDWSENESIAHPVEALFGNAIQAQYINNQPNWFIAQRKNAAFLVIPIQQTFSTSTSIQYQCIRLNSTATQKLGQLLRQQGIDGLLAPTTQKSAEYPLADLRPNTSLVPDSRWPSDTLDLLSGPMAQYYWELFFHAPFLVANQLQAGLQFETAKTWYQVIFNPTIQSDIPPADPNMYNLRPANYAIRGLLSAGTPVFSAPEDDKWSKALPLPFAFEFYGKTYQEVIVGTNGLISFEIANAGLRCPLPPTITNNSIFGLFTDLDPRQEGTITYSTSGTTPNRAFMVNFNAVRQYDSPSSTVSFQIALLEGSNDIEINIKHIQPNGIRPSILGIRGNDESESIFAPGKNSGAWSMDAASWHFIHPQEPQETEYWQFIGLREENNPTLRLEHEYTAAENYEAELANVLALSQYHNDPYDAHAIARLRPIAYQKSVVMHYVDNLISWGDNLFKRFTLEDINEAEMFYVMAFDLLGPQPIDLTTPQLPESEKLDELLSNTGKTLSTLDEFLIHLESVSTTVISLSNVPSNYIPGAYFGIPENTQFQGYWTTVKARLFNIRHGLNIKGQLIQPALFQPALNPATLVAQVGSGKNVRAALDPIQQTIPYYRFSTMLQKAKEVTSNVIQLGNALLAALEKKDAAALNMLYNTNQQHILALTKNSKQDGIQQATINIAALQTGLESAMNRQRYYDTLINDGYNAAEISQLTLTSTGIGLQAAAAAIRPGVAIAALFPTVFGFSFGGIDPAKAAEQTAVALDSFANIAHQSAGLSGVTGGFQRRSQEWEFQKTLADDDVKQATNHLEAAKYQLVMAQDDLDILTKNLEQEQRVEIFLKNKFSNEQLYDWTIGKLSALYFQGYRLATDFAVQAQHAWQFEKGIDQGIQSFIQPGQWNSLHQGLFAGEALQLDLQRMEAAYMKQDQRRLEVTKTIALSQLKDAAQKTNAISDLKTTGSCVIQLTRDDFDADYGKHYCRQITSVSVSIPAVLGPYQNIHATLTQTSNQVYRTRDDKAALSDFRSNQQIAISHGMRDSGLFQLNFNDPRYLPFEGTGAISTWELSIPLDKNTGLVEKVDDVDQLNLSEVVLEINYTALG